MAERAGLARATVSKIEKGDPNSSIGGYASVLFVLGMNSHLCELADAARDIVGLRLDEERLPQRIRLPRRKRKGDDEE